MAFIGNTFRGMQPAMGNINQGVGNVAGGMEKNQIAQPKKKGFFKRMFGKIFKNPVLMAGAGMVVGAIGAGLIATGVGAPAGVALMAASVGGGIVGNLAGKTSVHFVKKDMKKGLETYKQQLGIGNYGNQGANALPNSNVPPEILAYRQKQAQYMEAYKQRLGLGQFCSNQMPNMGSMSTMPGYGNMTPNAVPYGNMTPNAVPYGNMTPNAVPYGNMTPNAVPYGNMIPNAVPYGNTTPNTQPFGIGGPAPTTTSSSVPTANVIPVAVNSSPSNGVPVVYANSNPYNTANVAPNQTVNANNINTPKGFGGFKKTMMMMMMTMMMMMMVMKSGALNGLTSGVPMATQGARAFMGTPMGMGATY